MCHILLNSLQEIIHVHVYVPHVQESLGKQAHVTFQAKET